MDKRKLDLNQLNVIEVNVNKAGFNKININELDIQARKVAKDYKQLEQQLLGLVIEIDRNKLFYKLGFNSLFKYLTVGLELSPAVACAFTNVARKAQEVPELKNQVESGKLSIYKAQRITSVLTPQNSKTWLALAENKSHRELEREVAIASPQNAVLEKSRYVSSFEAPKEKIIVKRDIPRMELQLGVSEKLMLKIRRAQDLESQRCKKNLSLEQTLDEVLSVYLEKRDPLKKAYRQKMKGTLQTTSMQKNCNEMKSRQEHPRQAQSIQQSSSYNQTNQNKKCRSIDKNRARANGNKREVIPAYLRHQLQIRDQSHCTYVDSDGKRCSAKRYLEAHHIKPVSEGGKNTLENLMLLCSGHHKSIHSRSGSS